VLALEADWLDTINLRHLIAHGPGRSQLLGPVVDRRGELDPLAQTVERIIAAADR
jgi:hypothetical protein